MDYRFRSIRATSKENMPVGGKVETSFRSTEVATASH